HIPRVLYHRGETERAIPSPAQVGPVRLAQNKVRSEQLRGAGVNKQVELAAPSCSEAGRRAIEDYLASVGLRGTVTYGPAVMCAGESTEIEALPRVPFPVGAREGGAGVKRADDHHHSCYQAEYEVPSPAPHISILVPTTGASRLLEPCLESIGKLTTYGDYEVLLLVDERNAPATVELLNRLVARPRSRVLPYPDRPFNYFNYSWVNNWGASQATGELLCFLNDDTAVLTPQWLERLAARALLPSVAAAGP